MERKKDGGGGLKGTGAKRTAINVIDKVWAKHHMRLTNSPTRRWWWWWWQHHRLSLSHSGQQILCVCVWSIQSNFDARNFSLNLFDFFFKCFFHSFLYSVAGGGQEGSRRCWFIENDYVVGWGKGRRNRRLVEIGRGFGASRCCRGRKGTRHLHNCNWILSYHLSLCVGPFANWRRSIQHILSPSHSPLLWAFVLLSLTDFLIVFFSWFFTQDVRKNSTAVPDVVHDRYSRSPQLTFILFCFNVASFVSLFRWTK